MMLSKYIGIATLFGGVALLSVIALQQVMLSDIKSDLDNAVKEKDQVVEAANTQIDYLTQSVKLSEQSNQKLLNERISFNAIIDSSKQELTHLNEKYHLAQTEIKELRVSSDENTKSWANDCMPFSAVILLKYGRKADCKNGSAN